MGDVLSPITFSPELYKRLVPSQFLSRHLASEPSVRPDARSPHQFREVSISTGSLSNTSGSSVVRLGNTIMACGVRAEITEPDPFFPKRGYIIPNIEIGPLCHSSLRSGPPSDTQQSVAFALLNILQTGHLVDLEDLCIEEKKAVWVLYIDIICLSHDGCVLSAATTAMVSALLNTSLPVARWDLDLNECRCAREYRPVRVMTIPHVVEFGVFDGIVLADMTEEEESLCEETVSITMVQSDLLNISKSGGRTLGPSQLDDVITLAEQRVQKMDTIVSASQKHRL